MPNAMVSVAQQMLKALPSDDGYLTDDLAECIDACISCAQACSACADACLCDGMVVELRRCITNNLNCGDICTATGQVLSRQCRYDAALTRAILELCRQACAACAEECEMHVSMGHCRICAEACRRCETACTQLLAR